MKEVKQVKAFKVLGKGLVCDDYSSEIILDAGLGRIPAQITPEGVFCEGSHENSRLLGRSGLSFVRGVLYGNLFTRLDPQRFSQFRLHNNFKLKPKLQVDSKDELKNAVHTLAKLVENVPIFKEYELAAVPRYSHTGDRYILDLYEQKSGDAVYIYLWSPVRGICNIVTHYDAISKSFCLRFDTYCKLLNAEVSR